MKAVIDNNLQRKLKKSKFYGLELDESTDISVSQNLMIYIRGVVDGYVETHFLSVKQLRGCTAEDIFESTKAVMKDKGISVSNLISLGTDGASVMRGSKSGVVKRFQEENPFLLAEHCAPHRLALAGSQAAVSIPFMAKYEDMINSLYYYFHNSPKNQNKLDAIHKVLSDTESGLKFKSVFGTRWLSFYLSVRAIAESYDVLISCLADDAQDKTCQMAKAAGLLKHFSSVEYILMTYFLYDVLGILHKTCLLLQKENLLYFDVVEAIETCKVGIRSSIEMNENATLSNFSKSGVHLKKLFGRILASGCTDIDEETFSFTFKDNHVINANEKSN